MLDLLLTAAVGILVGMCFGYYCGCKDTKHRLGITD